SVPTLRPATQNGCRRPVLGCLPAQTVYRPKCLPGFPGTHHVLAEPPEHHTPWLPRLVTLSGRQTRLEPKKHPTVARTESCCCDPARRDIETHPPISKLSSSSESRSDSSGALAQDILPRPAAWVATDVPGAECDKPHRGCATLSQEQRGRNNQSG